MRDASLTLMAVALFVFSFLMRILPRVLPRFVVVGSLQEPAEMALLVEVFDPAVEGPVRVLTVRVAL